jgi:STE24 endopeptidase
MNFALLTAWIAAALIVLRLIVELWLASLNRRHVLRHATAVPDSFKDVITPENYAKSVEYTLAKSRFGQITDSYGAVVLLLFLFSGVLPWFFGIFSRELGFSAWTMAAYLVAVIIAMSLPGMPFDWREQFRLEQKFGFNTTTQKTWWLDRVKGFLLGLALGYPLLVLI